MRRALESASDPVVARRGVDVPALEVEAISESVHLGLADYPRVREVAYVYRVHFAGVPVAGVEHATFVTACLGLRGLDGTDVLRARPVGYVDDLDAGAALSDEHEVAGDLDAGRLLDRVVVAEDLRRGGRGDVDEPGAGAPRGHGEKAVRDLHLPQPPESAERGDETRASGL